MEIVSMVQQHSGMVEIPVGMPRSDAPGDFLNRLAWENASVAPTIGVSEVPRPPHIEANLLAFALAEPRRHDHVFGAERLFLHELGKVSTEIGMDAVIVTEIE